MEVEMLRGEGRAEHLELALPSTLLPRVQIPEGSRQVDVHTCRLHGLSCDDVQQPALHLAHQAGHLREHDSLERNVKRQLRLSHESEMHACSTAAEVATLPTVHPKLGSCTIEELFSGT